MKKIIVLLLIFFTSLSYSQTPTINQVKSIGYKLNKNEFDKIYKLNKEKERLLLDTLNVNSSSQDSINEIVNKKNNEIELQIAKIISPSKYQVINYIEHYDSIISKYKSEYEDLVQLQANFKGDDIKMDSIGELINKKYNQIKDEIVKKNKKIRQLSYSSFLPSFNKKNRAYFFETMYNNDIKKTSFLNSFGISGNEYGIVGQSELLADNISALRITFGTVIAASNNEDNSESEEQTKIESLDRLINGGGNFYLDLAMPLFSTIDKNNSDLLTSYTYASLRAATDIKGYGNDIDTSTGNCSLGFFSYYSFSSENRKFNFFVQANASYSLGSKEFYKNLQIDHNNGFFNGKIIAGLTLDNKYRVTANFLTFGSEESLRREKISIGIQLLP